MIDPASIAAVLSKLKAAQAAAATTAGTTASSAAAAPIVNKSMTTAAINAGASNAPSAAAALPPMPVSQIAKAPAQLAAQQVSGINNIGSAVNALGSGSSNLAAISAPTNIASGPTPIPQGTPQQNYQETLAQYTSDKIQHHPLVTSRAQFTPINTDRTNPFRKASLFDMLQEMYGV